MKRNCIILLIMMTILALGVHLLSFDKAVNSEQGVETVKKIPLQLGDWQGRDFPLDPIVYDILETKSILHRSYRNRAGEEVFLSLVYYQETKVDFHAPEGCLGGQGIKTEKSPAMAKISLDSGKTISLSVNQLLQDQDGAQTLVYYFYKTGDFVGRDYLKLRWNLVLNKFKRGQKSGSLVRVSTPLSTADDGQPSREMLEQFLSNLFPYLVDFL